MESTHISLCKQIYIKEFQITPLVAAIRARLSTHKSFTCSFAEVTKYTNEDETRCFAALDIAAGFSQVYLLICSNEKLRDMVGEIDMVLKAFGKPVYYAPPLFHASFAWWLPGKRIDLAVGIDEVLVRDLETFEVREVCCKIGNLEFEFILSSYPSNND
jgi:hypothetical protein